MTRTQFASDAGASLLMTHLQGANDVDAVHQ